MENTTLSATIRLIETSIYNNNQDFILLIKTAREMELINEQLAKIYFISGLHKGFLWERNEVLIQHAHFGLDAKETGQLYYDFLSVNLDSYIFSKTSKNISYFDTVNSLMDKFKEALEAEVLFPKEFFTSELMEKFMYSEKAEQFKELNQQNMAKYLTTKLPNAQKKDSFPKI